MARQERRAVFKDVAVELLKARPMSVIKGTAGGDIVCPNFLKDVALIADGILAEADKFEKMTQRQIDTQRNVRLSYDDRQKEYTTLQHITVTNWREVTSAVIEKSNGTKK